LELVQSLFDIIRHLDHHLVTWSATYGVWIYAILFGVIFAETGLVVAPFLPGDSLLFVAGAVAAAGSMDVNLLVLTLVAAAFFGNLTNFHIGRFIGPRVFRNEGGRFFRRDYLERTHAFFERHGGKAIIISRFLPILRTYAPFVAGISQMSGYKFALFNLAGAVAWVASLVYAGYLIGNQPLIKNNLTLVIIAIIVVSLLPGAIAYLRSRPRPT
jgi:membrane-associated protein